MKSICEEDSLGNKFFFNLDGFFHRENGPAIEYADGTKKWVFNGKLHRENGPAVELPNGKKHWFLNGREYSEEIWQRMINIKAFW